MRMRVIRWTMRHLQSRLKTGKMKNKFIRNTGSKSKKQTKQATQKGKNFKISNFYQLETILKVLKLAVVMKRKMMVMRSSDSKFTFI